MGSSGSVYFPQYIFAIPTSNTIQFTHFIFFRHTNKERSWSSRATPHFSPASWSCNGPIWSSARPDETQSSSREWGQSGGTNELRFFTAYHVLAEIFILLIFCLIIFRPTGTKSWSLDYSKKPLWQLSCLTALEWVWLLECTHSSKLK